MTRGKSRRFRKNGVISLSLVLVLCCATYGVFPYAVSAQPIADVASQAGEESPSGQDDGLTSALAIEEFLPFDQGTDGISLTEKLPLDEVVALLPSALAAQVEGSDASVDIPVVWQCEDDYENETSGAYTFTPKWDESLFVLATEEKLAPPAVTVNVESELPSQATTLALAPADLTKAANGAYIGGASGDPLKLVYNTDYFTVKVQHKSDTGYSNQYYPGGSTEEGDNGNNSGVRLRFTCNDNTYTYGTSYLSSGSTPLDASTPCAEGGGFSSSVDKAKGVISMKWNKLKVGTTGVTFDFELRYAYTSGSENFTRSYIITPHGASFTDTKLAYGGDAYFSGSDYGYSWALWDDAVHMVYLKALETSNTMSLSSNSAAYYCAGDYSYGKEWANDFSESNKAENAKKDNAYYLQWRPGTIADGESNTQTAMEGFSDASGSIRLFTSDNNPAKADAAIGQILQFNFVAANMSNDSSTLKDISVSSSSSDITAEYIGEESYTIERTVNVVLPVRVFVPEGTSSQEVQITLDAKDGNNTQLSASAPLSVEALDFDLPSISNVVVDKTNRKISFDVINATVIEVFDPSNTSLDVSNLEGNGHQIVAATDGTYLITAKDSAGRCAFVEAEIDRLENNLDFDCPDVIYTGSATLSPSTTENDARTEVTYAYKKTSDPDSAYAATAPTAAGEYSVRATSAGSIDYKECTVVKTAKISYLALPDGVTAASAIEVVGTQGEGGWYVSDVNIRPKQIAALNGYTISESLDGTYVFSLAITQNGSDQGPAKVHLMNAQGQKTDSIDVATIKIDKEPPTASVAIDTHTWDSFQETVTFSLLFEAQQQATVSASDNVSGIANTWIGVSPNDYRTAGAAETGVAWASESSVTLPEDSKNIVYVKVTDNAGNLTYVRSDGVVITAKKSTLAATGDSVGWEFLAMTFAALGLALVGLYAFKATRRLRRSDR